MATRAKRTIKWPLLYAGFIISLVGVAILLISVLRYVSITRTGDITPSNETIVTVDTPSERPVEKPSAINYSVPADRPRTISIDDIGVHAFVQPVGVNAKNEMATPTNIAFTGWYVQSVKPGEKGVMIINGHDGGRYRDGVFKQLHSLRLGQSIVVEKGDGTKLSYTVESLREYPVKDAATPLFGPALYERELRLITCVGAFDSNSQTFDRRLIVTARQI